MITTPKIFCVGSNKTGTSSLAQALDILGFKVCPEGLLYNEKHNFFKRVSIQDFNEIFKIVKRYDAFQDRPWNHTDFYKTLDYNFPNSKFILTIRNPNLWYASYTRWAKKSNLKNLWYYRMVSNICYDVDDFLSDRVTMIKKYNKRNTEIQEYFSNTNRLLVIDIDSNFNWTTLCDFLDKPIPTTDFPFLNKT